MRCQEPELPRCLASHLVLGLLVKLQPEYFYVVSSARANIYIKFLPYLSIDCFLFQIVIYISGFAQSRALPCTLLVLFIDEQRSSDRKVFAVSYGIRIVDITHNDIQIGAVRGSNLYQLIRPDYISRKEDRKVLRALRKQERRSKVFDFSLIKKIDDIKAEELILASDWTSEPVPRWDRIFASSLYSATLNLFFTPGFWSKIDAKSDVKDSIRTEGGEVIFLDYVDGLANAMLVSSYCDASKEQQKELFETFKVDFVYPTAKALREHMVLTQKHHKDLESMEVNVADIAAETYLAARN